MGSGARFRWLVLAVATGVATACASRGEKQAPAPAPSACRVVGGRVSLPDSTVIVVDEAVTPDAVIESASLRSRMAFHFFYETLVRIDCLGRVRPGLASRWEMSPDARTWTVSLHPSLRFWDGTSVTAAAVVDMLTDTVAGMTPLTLAGVDVLAVGVDDDTTLHIISAVPDSALAAKLAHPATAVRKGQGPSGWPVGTGPSRPVERIRGTPESWTATWIGADDGPWKTFILRGPVRGDPRDILDRGSSWLVTDDPDELDYARSRPHVVATPLPWDRTYGMLAGRFARDAERGVADPSSETLTEFRATLARDAVPVDARAGRLVEWWAAGSRCPLAPSPRRITVGPGTETVRIVYRNADSIARAVASRLVATALDTDAPHDWAVRHLGVGRGTGQRRPTAVGLDDDAFSLALEAGIDLAYIVALPRVVPLPCREAQAWVNRVPWLGSGGEGGFNLTGFRWMSLVDTRRHLVLHEQVAGVAVDGRGVPFLDWRR
ncbi:MAG: ABC transporter substrate-binding protein [Gemmatimonadetes bacterium]|nr:ABC transporter substrate-binding protein [Gemmatimonadota bacterium]